MKLAVFVRSCARPIGRAVTVEKYAKLGSSAIRTGLERLHKRGGARSSGGCWTYLTVSLPAPC